MAGCGRKLDQNKTGHRTSIRNELREGIKRHIVEFGWTQFYVITGEHDDFNELNDCTKDDR